MDERTGLYVAAGIDVAVRAPAGNAAADVFSVVPEVDGKERLRVAVLAYPVVHELALLGRDHQIRHRALADGHVGKEPDELRAHLYHGVEVLLAAYDLGVRAGVAAGDAEGQLVALEYLHGADDGGVGTAPAATVGGLLKALDAYGGDEVLHAQHLAGEGLVYQRAVGKAGEHAVGVSLAEPDDVLFAHERLAAGEEVDVGAHALGLRDDAVHLLIREVHVVAVLGGPAAGAVQVAGARRTHEDGPGNVAVVFFFKPPGRLESNHPGIDDEVFKDPAAHARVYVREEAQQQLVPVVVPVAYHLADGFALRLEHAVRHHGVEEVHDFRDVLLRVLLHVVVGLHQPGPDRAVFYAHFFLSCQFELCPAAQNAPGRCDMLSHSRSQARLLLESVFPAPAPLNTSIIPARCLSLDNKMFVRC